jgi:NAD(P)-dependent dehydrogenase (short-subunit alcohol dehydrogenase family)
MATEDLSSPGLPCPTTKYHRKVYPAISADRPELSLKGKTVVFTGAGTGIGRETAKAFATAGASALFLVGGRREALLQDAKKELQGLFGGLTIELHPGDISDKAFAKQVAASIHSWDVLALNAGYLPKPARLLEADLDDWAKASDINLKGNLQLIQALLPSRNAGASIIGTTSCVINFDTAWTVGIAPYTYTKLALCKMFEIFAAEVADTHWVTFHPGASKLQVQASVVCEDANELR